MDRIFDPFFTTKAIGVGTGLGLSICHNIVTGMGGKLTAANRESGGAVFRVTLPAASRPRMRAPVPTPVESSSARRAAILVIDDEVSVGQMLRRRLRDHDVTPVTSAREALELLARDVRFDVILSDLMMPEMSGMQLYDELVRTRPEIALRIVFMTGGAFTRGAPEFLERVPNECLEKPFTEAALRAAIQRVIK
jgi:CheY-like chemotaxis protein